eukprot:6717066-Prymnesium_polylepis.2
MSFRSIWPPSPKSLPSGEARRTPDTTRSPSSARPTAPPTASARRTPRGRPSEPPRCAADPRTLAHCDCTLAAH